MSKLIVKRYASRAARRLARVRSAVSKNLEVPRLSVFKSNKYLYAQIIDQKTGKSVAGVRSKTADEAGKRITEKAMATGIKNVIFDRGSYRYHGKVKLLAESAREAGLEF